MGADDDAPGGASADDDIGPSDDDPAPMADDDTTDPGADDDSVAPEPDMPEPVVAPEPDAVGGAPGEPQEPEPGAAPAEPGTPVEETPSTGCSGSASPPDGPQAMDVDGTERTYIVSLPDGYDPATPYPLIFAFHGLGGSADLVSSNSFYFGIEQTGGTPSIFVYPDGLDSGMGAGWPNDDGRDVAFFDALLAHMQSNYCVDSARVFSTGHSYGGMMTHTLACERADVLRGIAPVAGAFFGGFGGGDCTGPVAAWGAHGDPDDTVDYESGLSAIQRVMETNGCDPDSAMPVEPEGCSLYACDEGFPVTWCVHDQNHDWPEYAAESIKAFFDSF